ncbi:MAG TPA: LLM class flavin-dependent oxidoreductase [Candidatus Dormibacteraeota bacterium]|nr:LLM class flavin-dependent oxidoreductase [Candidatus Dormibacteraeota bacterium]
MKVDLGLLLPSREVLLWGDSNLRHLVDTAVEAERLGYQSVWAGDSLLARPRGEPLTILSAVAGATTRVKLGTAVLLPLLRRPVQLAHVLATLDRVSRGRLIVGAGPGADVPGTREELAAVDVPADRRVSAMLQTLDRCRALWRDEEPNTKLLPTPFTPGGPPVWLGAHGPRLLRETGSRLDGWLPFSPTPDVYAADLSAVREAAAVAGRNAADVTAGVYLTVTIGESKQRAAEEFDSYIRAYYGVPGEVMARLQASHAGTMDSATEWIHAYVAAGAQHVVVRLARPTLDGFLETAAGLLHAMQ